MSAIHTVELIDLALSYNADINHVDNEGWTPLHNAARDNNAKAVELLIDAHAELEATTPLGWTPLGMTISKMSDDAGVLLLQAGADFNVRVGPMGEVWC